MLHCQAPALFDLIGQRAVDGQADPDFVMS